MSENEVSVLILVVMEDALAQTDKDLGMDI